jgi:hypothetical protein
MSHLSKGIVLLDDSSNESVGSEVDEVVQWDDKLCKTKTFKMVDIILSSRKFESANLESQQKILLNFLNQPTPHYFQSRSPQAKAFKNLK